MSETAEECCSITLAPSAMEPPVPTFYLKSVPVYKRQDPFDHYSFSKMSGRGGHATVYFCQHCLSGKEYACKVIQTRDDNVRVQSALREACMLVAVSNHPSVASLEEVWVHNKSYVCLIMEKCEGGEVFDTIASRGALPEHEAAMVLRLILQIAAYCHARNLIHHDLKLENFMLKDAKRGLTRDNIRAIDFGSTALVDQPGPKTSGTAQYAAPEIIQGVTHDQRADVWTTGVLLYCMLSGLAPFEGDNQLQVKQAVLTQPVDYHEDPWPFVSDTARDLCQRLLTRDVDERIVLKDALRHPWMRQHCLPLTGCEIEAFLSRLRAFQQLTPIQRYLLREYAKPFEKCHDLHKPAFALFDWLDLDGDGLVDLGSFIDGMQDIGPAVDGLALKGIFEALKQSEEGPLSWLEFLAAVIDRQRDDDKPAILLDLGSDTAMSEAKLETASSSETRETSCHFEMTTASSSCAIKLEEAWAGCWPSPPSRESDDLGSSSGRILSYSWPSNLHCFPFKPDRMSLEVDGPMKGGSPVSESSWDRMRAVRGGSPRSPAISEADDHNQGSGGESPSGTCLKSSHGIPDPASTRSKYDSFASGGVTYWTGEGRQTEYQGYEEDSDDLYGPALAHHQAKYQ